ncbi:hypothetical protein [Streptomyces showdoensis]|uniref:Uncharacterized protein n=1 Tax=Streptomyces showdoensis TaxID=68268 RepID=A0A2P2GSY7_STREW|nr:hypothetical protein [Streptomyces showdoensis]KKZ74055.1 hypothetical protein VO63_09250 [Streptomyces showdoensis]
MSNPVPAAPAPAPAPGRRVRVWALVSAGLLVPATVLAGILALSADHAGRCLGYAENCGSNPGWTYGASLGLAAVALVVALAASRETVRRAALGTQVAAELVFLLLVVTTFA